MFNLKTLSIMKYFNQCETLNDVKSLYRNLAKEHHPDKGGVLAVMQEINNEYAFAIRAIAKGLNLAQEDLDMEILNAEQYKDAINAIINLEDISIEICGGWIWVTGNTFPHRSKAKGGTGILGENGFVFASKKVAWYFRSAEYKVNNRKKLTLDEIRHKYGSHKIAGNYSKSLAY